MRVSAALMVGLLVVLPDVAEARPVFPGAVRGELGLEAEPPCAICHTGSPSRTTAKQPFARALLAHAEPPGRLPSASALLVALRNMTADGTDSDGDGLADAAELPAGRDPNAADDPDHPVVPDLDAGTRDAGMRGDDRAPAPEGAGCAISRRPLGVFAFTGFAVALVLLRRKRP